MHFFQVFKMMSLLIYFLVSLCHGTSGHCTGGSSVMEGDSVILHTGVSTDQQEELVWYFNDSRIAKITGDLSKICTDVQCIKGDGRFKERLTLDNQTGSLTITNTKTTDSGDYKLVVLNSSSRSTIFKIAVQGVSAAQKDEMKGKSVKEGEPVTLHPGITKNPKDSDDVILKILIAEIIGNQSKICTDEQCTKTFRDRLELDHQTGSLTITNTKTTDSGLYTLQISSSIRCRLSLSLNITIVKNFSVSVTAVPDSGLPPVAVGGISVLLLLMAVAVAAVARKKGKWCRPSK